MEFTGKLINIAEPKSGISKTGKEWKSLEIVAEDHEEYTHKGVFKIFGADKVDNFLGYHKIGDEVKVSFDLNASEWNGKWYNSLDAWKVELISNAQLAAPAQSVKQSHLRNPALQFPMPINVPADGGHVNDTELLPF